MTLAENARLERGLLPKPLLRSDLVACATYYQPGRNLAVLGGDFFDVVETADGQVRAVIGDVMGHGPDEAALGVHLRVAWRTLVLAGVPDDQILATPVAPAVGRERRRRGFVTACDITIDRDLGGDGPGGRSPAAAAVHRRRLVLPRSRGRPAARRRGADRRRPGAGRTPAAGRCARTQLQPGSSLILYTDGLLDAYRIPANRRSLGIDELLDATERGARLRRAGVVVDPDDRRQRAGALGRRHRCRGADRRTPAAAPMTEPGQRPAARLEFRALDAAPAGRPLVHRPARAARPHVRDRSSSRCSTSRARATTSSTGGSRRTRLSQDLFVRPREPGDRPARVRARQATSVPRRRTPST